VATAVPKLRVAQLDAHALNVSVLLASQQYQPWNFEELRLRLRQVMMGFV